jgi:hypothetical protein
MQTPTAAPAAPIDPTAPRVCVECIHYRDEVETDDYNCLNNACAHPHLPIDLVRGGVAFVPCSTERRRAIEPGCGPEGRNFERLKPDTSDARIEEARDAVTRAQARLAGLLAEQRQGGAA